jgi:cleavage and polyadenylation specificity factor subunit 1
MDAFLTLDRDIPYSPSFILDLPAQVDQNLRNITDFVFLPGFNNPTLAMLYQTEQTWTGCVSLPLIFHDIHSISVD